MAIINYTDQLKFAGKGYLDAKMMPVDTVDGLYAIPRTQRFEGLTITVLNNGNPMDYWLVGGTADANWVPKGNGNLQALEEKLNNEIDARIEGDKQINTNVSSLSEKLNKVSLQIQSNIEAISKNTSDIKNLVDRVNALSVASSGSTPDNKTIGISDDENKALYVKILEKDGNLLKQDVNENNESGLFVSIPLFMEDDELN
jgi:hypothetical protein